MYTALEKWDHLVSQTISPEQIGSFQTEASRNLVLLQSSELAAQVKKLLQRQVFAFPSEKAIELYVQQHQSALIHLLNRTEAYRQSTTIGAEQEKLYDSIEEHLGSVLHFIEQYFPKYFNVDETVPMPYFKAVHRELCQQLERCRTLLEQQKDGDFAELVCGFLQQFCDHPEMTLTYRSLLYYKELFSQIARRSGHDNGNHYPPLMELLVYLNFNSASFVSLCLQRLVKEMENTRDIGVRLEILARHRKQLGQLPVKPGFALNRELPGAREQLIAALSGEMEYLKTICQMPVNTPSLSPATSPVYKDFVHVSFRAPEIYLLCKAFVDAGGAPTETYTSLLEKTAPYLSNKKQKGFSPDSLIKASDKVNPESRDTIRRFLQRMMRNLESYD